MKKIAISSLMAIIASILLSNIALGATALDNLQVQINATVNTGNNNQHPAPAPKKDHDEDENNEHKDNGNHYGEKKKEHKD